MQPCGCAAAQERTDMEFLRIPKEENILTKPLYEEVFSEDKGAFSDYYYDRVAPESTIYVARDGLEASHIQAMVHLNPYTLNWNGELIRIPYIVAVATRSSMRHQGLMRSLLQMIFRDLNAEHVPFAFLMPVNEAIYKPFGFERTWNWQWEEDVMNSRKGGGQESLLPAELCSDETLQRLADSVNKALTGKYELFTERSVAYYRRLAREQKASGGQLNILLKGGQPSAAVQSAREEYPPMMCRVMDREAYERRLTGQKDRPFEKAYVCEVV